MTALANTGYDVRSKNAGPFWLTVDIFCENADVFERLCKAPKLKSQAVADLLKTAPEGVKIFQINALNVIKISLPRPIVQGAIADRDMHGAQWACLLQEELEKKA